MKKHLLTLPLCILCFVTQSTAESAEESPASSSSLVTSISSISSIENDLPYDDSGKLASYHLVFPKGDQAKNCPATLDTFSNYGFVKTALEGQALDFVFPDYDNNNNDNTNDNNNSNDNDNNDNDNECMAACLERGSDRSLAGYVMPHRRYNASDTSFASFNDWFSKQCTAVEVCLMNYYDEEYDIENYWVPDFGKGTPQLNQVLQYGERNTRCFMSFIGHNFQVQSTRDGHIFAKFQVDFPLLLAFGSSPDNPPLEKGHFDNQIRSTLKTEWIKKDAPQRTFSPLGFSKGKLPLDVFGAMGAFYYNNRNHKYREEWRGKGVFVNWWETDVNMIQIPWSIKDIWQKRLVDLVSDWAGVPVEQTVMYGLRQYQGGARLLTHVDRLTTHVVSLIVNVAQGGLEEEWPVEVFDHYGRLHEVVMEPGDMVYYESAKNLHSRNRPLKGKDAFYTNLFTHYRPVGEGDDWYKNPTEAGREPVLEEEGECHVPKEVVSKETEYLGYGRVKCDDARLGKNISPSLFKVEKADDLIAWWERTTPDGGDVDVVGDDVIAEDHDGAEFDDDDDEYEYEENEEDDDYYGDDDDDNYEYGYDGRHDDGKDEL
mmetsp:Transcript_23084/g.34191  ORF Transcript_23084/g.34191 Transcript_23084/m.34191 type:complete len:599 (+) Transcript_23084:99-1895(+)